jgi:PleD family two-component response regulator
MQLADAAMYEAKKGGRNGYRFHTAVSSVRPDDS